MVRVAVIGSNGQLASDLIPLLESRGHEVIGFLHSQIEVSEVTSVREILHGTSPDVVINTAAFHKVDVAEDHPELAFAVNTLGPYNIAGVCAAIGVPLVHLSTDYVFSGCKNNPYEESDAVGPLNSYGTSKATGEMALRYVWPRHFIIRTGALYGVAGPTGKGENFVQSMLRMASEGESIKVVEDQHITPTSTVSLACQIEALIETEAFGTYHATCQGETTWYGFANEIFRYLDLDVDLAPQTTKESGGRALRPLYSVLENANLKSIYFDLMPTWQEALHEYLCNAKD